MKDEYDFSGGTRGKFHRPNSRMRLPYHRGSQSWLVDVALTGRWWQPEFWRDAEYLAASPWSAERVDQAFQVLIELYTEAEAKAAFGWVLERDPVERARRMERSLWRLLSLPLRPDLSPLLRLGFDLLDAELTVRSDLARRLRSDVQHEWKSARFELRCLAAFRNAGLDVVCASPNEPPKCPDFALRLQDRAVHINAQYAEEGEWAKEEQSWLWKLSMASVGRTEIAERPLSAHVRLTSRFQELQQNEAGRAYLRANIDRLAAELAAAKIRLANTPGPFPAFEIIEDLVEVKVVRPLESAGSGSTTGVPTDIRREVTRVVRGAVARGAAQLPSGEPGLVLLDPGMHAPSHLLVEEVKRWMATEGAAYANLAGVLVIAEVLVEPVASVVGCLEQIVPVWRDEAPRWIVDGPWDVLSDALSARAREALEHRARITVSDNREDLLLAAVG
jgi:hypothetical protein